MLAVHTDCSVRGHPMEQVKPCLKIHVAPPDSSRKRGSKKGLMFK